MIRYDVMWYDTIWCGDLQYLALALTWPYQTFPDLTLPIRYIMHYTIQSSPLRFDTEHPTTEVYQTQHITAQHSTIPSDMIQYNAMPIQYNTARCYTISRWQITILHCTTLHYTALCPPTAISLFLSLYLLFSPFYLRMPESRYPLAPTPAPTPAPARMVSHMM